MVRFVADAQNLPFADGTLGNIVMVDVLHHIEYLLGSSGKRTAFYAPAAGV